MVRAVRFMWTMNNGDIPCDKEICHSRGNTTCVTLDHIKPMAHKENMADMKNKGRGSTNDQRGDKSSSTKLSRDKVIDIREMYRTCDMTHQNIADIFGVSRNTVSSIIENKTWEQ